MLFTFKADRMVANQYFIECLKVTLHYEHIYEQSACKTLTGRNTKLNIGTNDFIIQTTDPIMLLINRYKGQFIYPSTPACGNIKLRPSLTKENVNVYACYMQ